MLQAKFAAIFRDPKDPKGFDFMWKKFYVVPKSMKFLKFLAFLQWHFMAFKLVNA